MAKVNNLTITKKEATIVTYGDVYTLNDQFYMVVPVGEKLSCLINLAGESHYGGNQSLKDIQEMIEQDGFRLVKNAEITIEGVIE